MRYTKLLLGLVLTLFTTPVAWGADKAATAPLPVMIIDVMQACRMPVAEVRKIIGINTAKWRVEKYDDPQWGHDEYWYLDDQAELQRLGLKSMEVSIEQGIFRAIYYTPAGEIEALERNLGYAGLKPDDLTEHHSGPTRWHTATDKTGQVISVRENGTWFECFEHHPGH